MSEQNKTVFVPEGCDQQGRQTPGRWPAADIGAWSAPHRTHPDGAHAASELQGDEPIIPSRAEDVFVWLLLGVCSALAIVTLLHLASLGG